MAASFSSVYTLEYLTERLGSSYLSISHQHSYHPLMVTVMFSKRNTEEKISFLVKEGCDINMQADSSQPTPIIAALMSKNKPAVEELIRLGADLTIGTNKENYVYPLYTALYSRCPFDIVILLLEDRIVLSKNDLRMSYEYIQEQKSSSYQFLKEEALRILPRIEKKMIVDQRIEFSSHRPIGILKKDVEMVIFSESSSSIIKKNVSFSSAEPSLFASDLEIKKPNLS
jgi:hypothetical protein